LVVVVVFFGKRSPFKG